VFFLFGVARASGPTHVARTQEATTPAKNIPRALMRSYLLLNLSTIQEAESLMLNCCWALICDRARRTYLDAGGEVWAESFGRGGGYKQMACTLAAPHVGTSR